MQCMSHYVTALASKLKIATGEFQETPLINEVSTSCDTTVTKIFMSARQLVQAGQANDALHLPERSQRCDQCAEKKDKGTVLPPS